MTSYKNYTSGKRLPSHSNITVEDYWYIRALDKWIKYPDWNYSTSTHDTRSNPKSYKAFIRYVKKHSKYLPKGTEFVWVSNFVEIADIVVKSK